MNCRNCGSIVQEKYCGNCGQKSSVGRITFSSLWHEVAHFFTHMESGFLFTSWQMLVAPGNAAIQYLDGKRKTYQPPVSYFLIWTTAYMLLLYWVEKAFGENVVIDYRAYFGTPVSTRFAISHLSVVLAVMIPVQAVFFFFIITRRIYTFPETMAVVFYALGSIILCQVLFVFLAVVLFGISGNHLSLASSDVFKVFYISWFLIDFVRRLALRKRWLRAFLCALGAFGAFSAWRLWGLPLVLKALFPGHL